ncbi:transglutaminase-like domain-containing protein [Aquincola tertiaricarbonis]|uniref:transglutaminase-like domain-containing protein n=1 Tax=Aquincola tertiaricarbonis TaxID=391953 RepID=UPI0009F95374|nr:transglutaminase family protein [Aquincola tertiaricarbonis]
MIRLQYKVDLLYDITGADGADFVFNIHVAETACQTIESEQLVLNQPASPDIAVDARSGTRFLRVHAAAGPLQVSYAASVRLEHHLAEPDTLREVPPRELPVDVLPYVYPSRYCQSDRLLKLAFNQFGQLWPGYSRVLAVQHWVQQHVEFKSNTSNVNTSAVDTLIEQVGVCRDFTHLMIALCRALNIPARIATGTDYGADPALGPPDFHAYVEVYLGDRWYLFDPSGTGIPMGFLRLGTGRDAADVAFATMFGQVQPWAPRIMVQAVEQDGAQLPHHCREAISTSAPATPTGRDWTSLPSKATSPPPSYQLPD